MVSPLVAPCNTVSRRFWTTAELAVVRERFPRGGVADCAAALKGRSPLAIWQQAYRLGFRRTGRNSRRLYEASDAIDAAIQATYRRAPQPNDVARLAATLNRPRWWVSRRARELCLVAPRLKEPDWTEAEEELLAAHAHKTPATIRRVFLRAGHARSEVAIIVKRKRLELRPSDNGYYTAHQLARPLGVEGKTVTRWIHEEGLPAERRGTQRTPQQGGDHWWIDAKRLRAWIARHAQLVDLRKVDRFWFIDLMANGENV